MIWTTIFSGDFFSLETNFGTTPYLRERSLLRITIEKNRNANIEIYYPEIDQRMSYDKGNGVVIIDITEYVRAYPQPSEPIVVSYFDDSTPVEWYSCYFMNVDREVIPQNGEIGLYAPVIAPSYFLKGLWGVSMQFVLYIPDGVPNLYFTEYVDGLSITNIFQPDTLQSVAVSGDSLKFQVRTGASSVVRNVIIRELQCRRQYALVQWQSRFGLTKRSTWEVAEVKHSATDVVELVNIYGGWKSRKGSEVSVVLRLRDLTPYDYWYYSDIITSNDVRVALNEIDKDLDDSTIVDVVTKSATVQNSGVKTLEVELKYRKYECPI
jgi:hypothetical protein